MLSCALLIPSPVGCKPTVHPYPQKCNLLSKSMKSIKGSCAEQGKHWKNIKHALPNYPDRNTTIRSTNRWCSQPNAIDHPHNVANFYGWDVNHPKIVGSLLGLEHFIQQWGYLEVAATSSGQGSGCASAAAADPCWALPHGFFGGWSQHWNRKMETHDNTNWSRCLHLRKWYIECSKSMSHPHVHRTKGEVGELNGL